MSKYFITFGSHNNYIDAANRLLKQVNDLNLFDKTMAFTSEYLKNDKDFWNIHKNFIEKNKRGYGYWLWKPYIIKKMMEQMNDNDILLYLDCGCEIDIRGKDFLIEYFDIVKKDYIIGTYAQKEKLWNKMDLILELDMNNDIFLESIQRQAGVVLYLVCEKTRKLVNEWYQIACNYHMIDDSPSINKNYDVFKEHRHDQSIFSLLTKKYNLYSNTLLNKCVKILRNKTGIPKI